MLVSVKEYPEGPPPVLECLEDETKDTPEKAQYEYYVVDTNAMRNNKLDPFRRMLKNSKPTTKKVWSQASKISVGLFLPLGYPQSVDSSYLPYQLYDGLQGLCSYWRGVVTTRAVLEAAGVGDAHATAASAAMEWALRDGTGMIGGLLFSYAASTYFDVYVKEFRLFADIINDVALTLDMMAPYVAPSWRLYILSISTIGKTLCGISAGATKGRITQHFSRHGNMADLSAKESTQETLVSLVGMFGGIFVANLLRHVPYVFTWILFGILTLLHVWANYKAVVLLKLATLNPERTRLALEEVVAVLAKEPDAREIYGVLARLPDPKQIDEVLARSTFNLLFPSINTDASTSATHFQFADLFLNENYIIGISGPKGNPVIHLGIHAKKGDELKAYMHALLVQHIASEMKLPVDRGILWK